MADCERHSDVAFVLGDKSFSAHRYACKCNMEGGREGEGRGGEGRGGERTYESSSECRHRVHVQILICVSFTLSNGASSAIRTLCICMYKHHTFI